MSAPRASETPSPANPFLRDLVASLRTVQLPGSPATYANRAYLRDLGLRWDPANHRWHGTTTTDRVKELRERLGLEVRCFGDLEAPPKGPTAPKPAPLGPTPGSAPIAVPARDPSRRPHDGSRTRAEARIAFPTLDEEEEVPTQTPRFTVMEITSGLPDDSPQEDERQAEWRLRGLRGRVKVASSLVATTHGLEEILAGNWKMACRFYARFGITESQFRWGVPVGVDGEVAESPFDGVLAETSSPRAPFS